MPARSLALSLSVAAAVVAMLVVSPQSQAESTDAQSANISRGTLKAGTPNMFASSLKVARAGAITHASSAGTLASAVRPLDLRKLSMSDFGDAEQGR